MDTLNEPGYFWWHRHAIPDGQFAPDELVTGLLKIDDKNRVTLDLHGVLPAVQRASDANPETTCVQGRLSNSGRHVFLVGLNINQMKFAAYGAYQGYRADFALVGGESVPSEIGEIAISSVEVELAGFEEWLHLDAIEFSRDDEGFSAQYKKEDDIAYELDDGEFRVKYELYAPFGTNKLQKLEARPAVSFIYRQRHPLNIGAAIQRYQLIQDILILLTNSNFALQQPTVSLERAEGSFTLYFQRNKGDENPPSRFDAWADFPELKKQFGLIFSNWKAKRDVFGPAFYLYLGTRRGAAQYIENNFLNLVVGIEALHREKSPKEEKVEHAEKIARILGGVELAKDRRWLKGKLAFAGEPTFAERLEFLFGSLPFGFDKKVLRKFADDCAKMRNDISHFGGWRKHGAYNDFLNEAYGRSKVLSFLYQALILREIGLSDDILECWLRRSHKSYPVKFHLEQFQLWKEPKQTHI